MYKLKEKILIEKKNASIKLVYKQVCGAFSLIFKHQFFKRFTLFHVFACICTRRMYEGLPVSAYAYHFCAEYLCQSENDVRYKENRATLWVLRTEPRSSTRAANTCNC